MTKRQAKVTKEKVLVRLPDQGDTVHYGRGGEARGVMATRA